MAVSATCTISDFRANATQHMKRLRRTGGAEVLTRKGKAEGVLMSPRAFEALAERAGRADMVAVIQEGARQMKAGEGIVVDEAYWANFDARLRARQAAKKSKRSRA